MKIRRKVTNMLDLPKEVTLDYPKITVLGEECVTVENHKGLIEFSKEVIRLNTNIYILKVTGEGLDIKNISEDELEICGKITELTMS